MSLLEATTESAKDVCMREYAKQEICNILRHDVVEI